MKGVLFMINFAENLKELQYKAPKDALKRFYIAVVRSAFEYGAQVWNGNLTKEQVKDIERIQKRAMKIICPELD